MDTSARNDENVNLLFQKVAERVLLIREDHARDRELGAAEVADGYGGGVYGAIPVTPGASIDEHGKVVKIYPRGAHGHGHGHGHGADGSRLGGDGGMHMHMGNGMNNNGHGNGHLHGNNNHHHPHQYLINDNGSPQRPVDKKGIHNHNRSGGNSNGVTEELESEESTTMGMCMGPLMVCASSKDDASPCIIC